MILESVYDKQEDIPEAHRPLFTERNGKFELTGVKGVKPEVAFNSSQEALRKERADHAAAKTQLKAFTDLGMTIDELHAKLDTIPQLEAAASGKVQQLTDAQKAAISTPLTREIEKLKKELTKVTEENTGLKTEKRTRSIHDAVRSAFTEMKGLPGAMEDALMHAERVFEITEDGKVVTRDNVGLTPGLDPKSWLQDIQPKRVHWWPPSGGGGASGSGGGGGVGGNNPWSKDHWNVTEQGKYVTAHGIEKANAAAAAAGSRVGAVAPPAPAK